jgi:DNA-binding GntR family transcriptional regulator
MKMGAKENSVQIVNEADVKFHTITMEISATHQTLQLWKSVLSRIRLQFYRLGPIPNLSLQAPEHELLLETLMTGDASVIDKALEKHIISTVVPNIKKISTVVPRP